MTLPLAFRSLTYSARPHTHGGAKNEKLLGYVSIAPHELHLKIVKTAFLPLQTFSSYVVLGKKKYSQT